MTFITGNEDLLCSNPVRIEVFFFFVLMVKTVSFSVNRFYVAHVFHGTVPGTLEMRDENSVKNTWSVYRACSLVLDSTIPQC